MLYFIFECFLWSIQTSWASFFQFILSEEMLCQVQFIGASLAPTSAWHTEPDWHTMHPGTEIPAIHADSCREILQTGYFCATSGEAQKAVYESESWSLPGALPSGPEREQAVGVYHLLLQSASFPSSCLLFACHRPYSSFAQWSFSPCLWKISVPFTKEAETLLFYWGLWLLWGSRHECFSGVAASLYCREVTTWFETQLLKATRKAEWKQILKEDWRMSTESQHWHGALCQRLGCTQSGCITGRARSVRRWWQSSPNPVV